MCEIERGKEREREREREREKEREGKRTQSDNGRKSDIEVTES